MVYLFVLHRLVAKCTEIYNACRTIVRLTKPGSVENVDPPPFWTTCWTFIWTPPGSPSGPPSGPPFGPPSGSPSGPPFGSPFYLENAIF